MCLTRTTSTFEIQSPNWHLENVLINVCHLLAYFQESTKHEIKHVQKHERTFYDELNLIAAVVLRNRDGNTAMIEWRHWQTVCLPQQNPVDNVVCLQPLSVHVDSTVATVQRDVGRRWIHVPLTNKHNSWTQTESRPLDVDQLQRQNLQRSWTSSPILSANGPQIYCLDTCGPCNN